MWASPHSKRKEIILPWSLVKHDQGWKNGIPFTSIYKNNDAIFYLFCFEMNKTIAIEMNAQFQWVPRVHTKDNDTFTLKTKEYFNTLKID